MTQIGNGLEIPIRDVFKLYMIRSEIENECLRSLHFHTQNNLILLLVSLEDAIMQSLPN